MLLLTVSKALHCRTRITQTHTHSLRAAEPLFVAEF